MLEWFVDKKKLGIIAGVILVIILIIVYRKRKTVSGGRYDQFQVNKSNQADINRIVKILEHDEKSGLNLKLMYEHEKKYRDHCKKKYNLIPQITKNTIAALEKIMNIK